jgi:serine/alanine adding enzyme
MHVTTTTVETDPMDSPRVHSSEIMPIVSTDVTGADWDWYVETNPEATVDHLWQWRQIIEGVFGHKCEYLVARRGEGIVGVLPLVLFKSRLFGKSAISVPFLNYGGVLADDALAIAALVKRATEIAREFGASHLELRHIHRQCPDLAVRQHKLRLTRPLPATPEALWKDIDRKVRNQVRKAQKEGLTVVEGGAELVDDFYAVFAHNMRDLGTPVYTKRLFSETLELFADRARVFVVRLGTRPVAASISLRFHDSVLVPWASSLREFRALCPNMFLYWTMMERAVSTGATVFDFGRSSPGGGTHHFKLQWGAVEAPLAWEYALITRATTPDQGPSNPKFRAAIEAWTRLPLSVANSLGPRIARHLP